MAPDTKHTLTPTELEWCKSLRQALKESPSDDASKAVSSQFALIGKGDNKKSLKRIASYNKVIAGEYGYDMAKCMSSIGFLNRIMPGTMEPCARPAPDADGCVYPTFAFDIVSYNPSLLKGEEQFREVVLECCLMMDAMCADLDDVRNGAVYLQQCKGLSMRHFNAEMEKRFAVLYQDAYPLRFHRMWMVNAGPIINVILTICKLFLKKKLAERIKVVPQDKLTSEFGYTSGSLPPCLGGTFTGKYEAQVKEALDRRAESVAKVSIA